ncbi:MAG: hypothetical protein IBJ03_05680 [Gemmatimonadaceae bacterium]|nr:hypothetical protein [Gemmatimonadaceae bacterium]
MLRVPTLHWLLRQQEHLMFRSLGTVVLVGASMTLAEPAYAQIGGFVRTNAADVSRVTFGYLCDDTFVLRNDGDKAITAALSVEKSGEQSPVELAAHEQVQFTSSAKQDVELWMDGKLVAKANKEKRTCKDVQGNAQVNVAPLEVSTEEQGTRRTWANYPFYDPWFYGALGPWGYGGLGMMGYRPFYSGYVGVPIIVGGRGGVRRR